MRGENQTRGGLATVGVAMRGFGLRSVREARSPVANRNTFSEYAIRRRRMLGLPFLETLPFQFGHFFHEALHLLIVTNGLAHALAPWLGDANLAQPAGMTLHEGHRLVQLAVGAMTVGFAGLAGTVGA